MIKELQRILATFIAMFAFSIVQAQNIVWYGESSTEGGQCYVINRADNSVFLTVHEPFYSKSPVLLTRYNYGFRIDEDYLTFVLPKQTVTETDGDYIYDWYYYGLSTYPSEATNVKKRDLIITKYTEDNGAVYIVKGASSNTYSKYLLTYSSLKGEPFACFKGEINVNKSVPDAEATWRFVTNTQYKSIMLSDTLSSQLGYDVNVKRDKGDYNVVNIKDRTNNKYIYSLYQYSVYGSNQGLTIDGLKPNTFYQFEVPASSSAKSAYVCAKSGKAEELVDVKTLTPDVVTGVLENVVYTQKITVKTGEGQNAIKLWIQEDNSDNIGKESVTMIVSSISEIVMDDMFDTDDMSNILNERGLNPNFAFDLDNWAEHWTVNGLTSDFGPLYDGYCYYAVLKTRNDKITEDGYVYQTVHLSAGAYTLSARALAYKHVAHLFANVGGREQLTTFYDTKETPAVRTLGFVVPVESDVTIGFRFNKGEYRISLDECHLACDNFILRRVGDAKGADLSSQIFNYNFRQSLANDDYMNTTFGWASNGSKGFHSYKDSVACVYNELDNSGNRKWETFNIHQTVTGLPDGWYKVRVQGVYCDNLIDNVPNSDERTCFYANKSSMGVQLATTQAPNTTLFTGGTDGYVNTLEDARKAFDNGMFNDCIMLTYVNDGKLNVGLFNAHAVEDEVSYYNAFRLSYYAATLPASDADLSRDFFLNNSFDLGTETGWYDGNATDNVVRDFDTPFGYDDDIKCFYYDNSNADGFTIMHEPIVGLPQGVYRVGVRVADYGSSSFTLIANGYSSNKIIDGKIIVENVCLGEAEPLTIKLVSTGAAKVDQFSLVRISSERFVDGMTCYLYNAEAGAFLSNGNDWNTRASVDVNGLKWTLNSCEGKEGVYSLYQSEATSSVNNLPYPGYIYMSYYPESDGDKGDPNFMFVDGQNYAEIKIADAGSSFVTLSLNPDDKVFGTSAFGESYIGWGGDVHATEVMPLIGADDKEMRGIHWMMLTESQYNTYKDVVADAHDARMYAWNILRSANASGLSEESSYVTLEDAYYDLASKADDIYNAAYALEDVIEAQIDESWPCSTRPLDMTYRLNYADCDSILSEGGSDSDGWVEYDECSHMPYKHFQLQSTYQRVGNIQFGSRFIEKWDSQTLDGGMCYQRVSNLPKGTYMVSVDANAENQWTGEDVEGVTLFVEVNGKVYEKNISTPGKAIQTISTVSFDVPDNAQLRIGIRIQNTNANWVAFDNFKLYYVGEYRSYEMKGNALVFAGTWRSQDCKEMSDIIASHGAGTTVDLTVAYDYTHGVPLVLDNKMNITLDEENVKNVLVYVPETCDFTINGSKTNVVVMSKNGGNCSEFVLADKISINVIKNFNAKVAKYSKYTAYGTNKEESWGTICLPFRVDNISDQFYLYTVKNITDSRINIYVNNTMTKANVPAIYCSYVEDLNIVKYNADVYANTDNLYCSSAIIDTSEDESCLYGVYHKYVVGKVQSKPYPENMSQIPNDDGFAAEDGYYISNNKFVRGNGWFNVSPCRAFLCKMKERNSEAAVRHDVLDFNIVEAPESDADVNEATGVTEVVDADATIIDYVDANGIHHDEVQQGLNIVRYSDGSTRKLMIK